MSQDSCGSLAPFHGVCCSWTLRLCMKLTRWGIIMGYRGFPCPFSPTSQWVREARLSLTVPSFHCLDLNQAPWHLGTSTGFAVRQTWIWTLNLKTICWVIEIFGLQCLHCQNRKRKVHRIVFKDRVIWKQCPWETCSIHTYNVLSCYNSSFY